MFNDFFSITAWFMLNVFKDQILTKTTTNLPNWRKQDVWVDSGVHKKMYTFKLILQLPESLFFHHIRSSRGGEQLGIINSVWIRNGGTHACFCVLGLSLVVCVPGRPQAPNQAWRLEAVLASGCLTWSKRHGPRLNAGKAFTPALHTGQIKNPYLKLGPENTGPLFPSWCTHTRAHTPWAGLIRFNYTLQLSVINCDTPLMLLLWILAFSFIFS